MRRQFGGDRPRAAKVRGDLQIRQTFDPVRSGGDIAAPDGRGESLGEAADPEHLGEAVEAGEAGDALMVAAILTCGLGYAGGATLSRRLGSWQVIWWALLLSLPFMTATALITLPETWREASFSAWSGLVHVSVFSMMVGFIFWYRGLALGGISGVGQLQLLQPFFGLLLAAVFLGEPVTWGMIASAAAVVVCVAGAKRFA